MNAKAKVGIKRVAQNAGEHRAGLLDAKSPDASALFNRLDGVLAAKPFQKIPGQAIQRRIGIRECPL